MPRAARRALPLYKGPDPDARAGTRSACYGAVLTDGAPSAARVAGTRTESFMQTVFDAQGSPACASGCAHCCHLAVTVTVPEVIAALDHAHERFSASEFDALRSRLRENARRASATSEYPKMACAFLQDNRCSVYEARPLRCRGTHSLDVAPCEEFGRTGASSRAMVQNPHAKLAAFSVLVGYVEALQHSEIDSAGYELQRLASMVLEAPEALVQWSEGKPAFASASTQEPTIGELYESWATGTRG